MIDTVEKPQNEVQRLEALRRYDILDSPPDGSFDHLTKLASVLFNVPIAIVSLVDEDRIWFKSKFGVDVNQIDRVPGLCASAILSPELYIVENAIEDSRTLTNPLVVGELGLRFYAAAPLVTREGYSLGTFCIIDSKQRYLTEAQKEILQRLADIVIDEIELRLAARTLLTNVSTQIRNTTKVLEELPLELRSAKVETTVAASKKLIQTIENHIYKPLPN